MPTDPSAFRKSVSGWSAHSRRDLPWRRTRDPWAVLVSEFMLQQTQVARVVPRYRAFLERFPDPASCAAASPGAVVAEWTGLGYNRRAVHLHRCAVAVVTDHAGTIPAELEPLLALPGVGPYTARAVLAFAYERDVGVLDTNVGRVLARVEGRRLSTGEAQRLADSLVPRRRGWAWNQAMLDLGATICEARAPRCSSCPARRSCTWQGGADGTADPATGSAAVAGRQSAFEGSDRQGRGRLVAALVSGRAVTRDEVAALMGWPDDPERAAQVSDSVVADGLAVRRRDGTLRLP